MKHHELEELLNDVLADAASEESARTHARTEFRSAVQRKRWLRATTIATLLVASIAVLNLSRNQNIQSTPSHVDRHVQTQNTPKQSGALSDDELLRCFPPGSCYLAEVDDKVVLVFRDPAVKKRFFN